MSKIATQNGEFVGVRTTGNHVTLWVEGSDEDGPSVSGTSLTMDQVSLLIGRLERVLKEWDDKAERKIEMAGAKRAKQLRKESSAGKRHFYVNRRGKNPSGHNVVVLSKKADRLDCVVVRALDVIGQPQFYGHVPGQTFTCNIAHVFDSVEDYLEKEKPTW